MSLWKLRVGAEACYLAQVPPGSTTTTRARVRASVIGSATPRPGSVSTARWPGTNEMLQESIHHDSERIVTGQPMPTLNAPAREDP